MKVLLFTLLIVSLLQLNAVNVQVSKGACPNLKTENLQVAKYLGRWYEISVGGWQRSTFQRNCVCTRTEYTIKDEGKRIVKVDNACNDRTPQGKLSRSIGEAVQRDVTDPGKLSVTFGLGIYSPYWVMETDYSNFASIYACNEILGYKFESAWIISRRPSMDEELYKQIAARLQEKTGFKEELKKTLQQGCSYP
jgi:lipocalin